MCMAIKNIRYNVYIRISYLCHLVIFYHDKKDDIRMHYICCFNTNIK